MKNKHLFIKVFTILFILSCQKPQQDYINSNKNKILVAIINSDSLDADGMSILPISAIIPTNASITTVKFSSLYGNFLDSGLTYTTRASMSNGQLTAKAYLVSSLIATNYETVTVSIANVDTVLSIRFTNALPDSILVSSSVAFIKNGFGNLLPVTATLYRTQGIPSLYQRVYFNAIKDDNSLYGECTTIDVRGSNNFGVVNGSFVLQDTSYYGRVRIIGSCLSEHGMLRDTLNVFIIH